MFGAGRAVDLSLVVIAEAWNGQTASRGQKTHLLLDALGQK